MSFDVDASAYREFMGRYSEPLAGEYVRLLGLHRGQKALDVGCGPGALTAVLADRLGAESVCAVDPSASFVAATRERLPGVDVRTASAEDLPYADGSFDVVVAQLVVHFMPRPEAGIAEMTRVARPGGIVTACVWDHAGERGPLAVFWRAVRDLDPGAADESALPGVRDGQLVELFTGAGLEEVTQSSLTVTVPFSGFDEWWHPFTLGVGPAGSYLAKLDPTHRDRVRARCADLLPTGDFTVSADAWTALARR